MFDRMKEDIITIFENDPAANSWLEVVFTYSGLHALWAHRFVHWFYRKRWRMLARIISQITVFLPVLKFILVL